MAAQAIFIAAGHCPGLAMVLAAKDTIIVPINHLKWQLHTACQDMLQYKLNYSLSV